MKKKRTMAFGQPWDELFQKPDPKMWSGIRNRDMESVAHRSAVYATQVIGNGRWYEPIREIIMCELCKAVTRMDAAVKDWNRKSPPPPRRAKKGKRNARMS